MVCACRAWNLHPLTVTVIGVAAWKRSRYLVWTRTMTKPRGTDGSLLSSLPWTLYALVFSLAPHAQFLPWWITTAFLVCAVWRFVIEKRRRPLPSTWIRAFLALLCFLGVLVSFGTVSGVGPGSALLAVMAALKLLETRKRRDQFVLLFICIFLVMSSLLREQYLWSLPYLIVGVFLIMTAWLRVSALAGESARRSFATGGRLVLTAVPLAIAMWIFFPRIATPFWAVPMDTGTASSGISDSMSPGDISSLSLSDAVAFRVTFPGTVPEPRDRYWRGLVLTQFNGRTWSGNDPYRGARVNEQVKTIGRQIDYQITMEPTRQPWVFSLDMPASWNLPRTFMGPQQQLARSRPIDQRISFEAVSFLDYRTEVELTDFARDFFRRVPAESNPKTQQLAAQMRAQAGSDAEYVEAVLMMFHEQEYFYTLEPPALGRNSVDQFMFDTMRGFCEHYASAFAVMMRAAGVPARVVLGYQGGEMNPMGGHMIVRQSDAHAWNEVWFEDEGWRRVDPTAAVAPNRIEVGRSASMFDGTAAAWGFSTPSRLLYQLTLTWDALDAQWNEWVLGYGPENQNRLMESLGMDDPDWRKMMLTLVGIVVGLILLISLVLSLRYRPPKRDRAAILYRRFIKKSGVDPLTGETPAVFAARAESESELPAAAVHDITSSYLDARYGPSDPRSLQRLETAISNLP
jgi:transglutaminase-like putative cysteine protease